MVPWRFYKITVVLNIQPTENKITLMCNIVWYIIRLTINKKDLFDVISKTIINAPPPIFIFSVLFTLLAIIKILHVILKHIRFIQSNINLKAHYSLHYFFFFFTCKGLFLGDDYKKRFGNVPGFLHSLSIYI